MRIASLVLLTILAACGTDHTFTSNCINRGEDCRGDKGKDGDKGDKGDRGEKGERGVPGEGCSATETSTGAVIACKNGSVANIKNGKDGTSCTTQSLSNGARISCTDGTQSVVYNGTNGTNGQNGQDGQDGEDGQDAPPSAYSVVELVDPCGKQASFDEVLLRLQNNQIMAHYADGAKQFLTIVGPGSYVTTDGTHCYFTVTNDLQITNQHN